MSRKRNKVESESLNISAAQQAYVRKHLLRRRWVRFYQIVILLSFIALWEITARLGILNSFVFSSPSRVGKTILEMTISGQLLYHVGITLLETLVSFALVNIVGLVMAVILWWNDNISKVLEPYLIVLNSLPKSALAPVFIVWLGNNMKTIIVAAVSVALFGTIITLYSDFKSVEEDKIKLIHTLGGNKRDVLFKVILPANIPSIISLMKVNIGLSLVGVVIGEFLASKAGLGYLIIYGSQVFTCVRKLILMLGRPVFTGFLRLDNNPHVRISTMLFIHSENSVLPISNVIFAKKRRYFHSVISTNL